MIPAMETPPAVSRGGVLDFTRDKLIGARGFGPKASDPAQRAQLHPRPPTPCLSAKTGELHER